jgi:hypothetical protein
MRKIEQADRRACDNFTLRGYIFDSKLLHCLLAAKFTATSIDGGRHANRSLNSRSGAFSLSRVKTMSKYPPESVEHQEASTDTIAVHFRSNVGGIISEN